MSIVLARSPKLAAAAVISAIFGILGDVVRFHGASFDSELGSGVASGAGAVSFTGRSGMGTGAAGAGMAVRTSEGFGVLLPGGTGRPEGTGAGVDADGKKDAEEDSDGTRTTLRLAGILSLRGVNGVKGGSLSSVGVAKVPSTS